MTGDGAATAEERALFAPDFTLVGDDFAATDLATALRRKPWAPAGAAFTNFRVDALVDARRVWIDCSEADGALSAVGVHLDADGRVFRVSAAFRIDEFTACPPSTSCECEILGPDVSGSSSVTVTAIDGERSSPTSPARSPSS